MSSPDLQYNDSEKRTSAMASMTVSKFRRQTCNGTAAIVSSGVEEGMLMSGLVCLLDGFGIVGGGKYYVSGYALVFKHCTGFMLLVWSVGERAGI